MLLLELKSKKYSVGISHWQHCWWEKWGQRDIRGPPKLTFLLFNENFTLFLLFLLFPCLSVSLPLYFSVCFSLSHLSAHVSAQ